MDRNLDTWRVLVVDRVSCVSYPSRYFVRRTDAIRPVTDSPPLDGALEFRSPCHANLNIIQPNSTIVAWNANIRCPQKR